jgi:hypothetical protein
MVKESHKVIDFLIEQPVIYCPVKGDTVKGDYMSKKLRCNCGEELDYNN